MKPILFVLLLTIMACKSIEKATKRVLADPAAKEKVGREWEKENPCVNDTVFSTDTVPQLLNSEPEKVPVPYPVNYCPAIDRTFPHGTRVKLDSTGLYVWEARPLQIIKTAVVEDTRRLRLARDTIATQADSIKWLNGRLAAEIIIRDHYIGKVKEFESKTQQLGPTFKWFIAALWDGLKWWLLILAIAYGLWRFRKSIFKLLPI